MTDADMQARARQLIACLDLTNLNDDCTEADVASLCDRAATPEGPVAAICIWPQFVAFAREKLAPAIRIATVVNFPAGGEDLDATLAETIPTPPVRRAVRRPVVQTEPVILATSAPAAEELPALSEAPASDDLIASLAEPAPHELLDSPVEADALAAR